MAFATQRLIEFATKRINHRLVPFFLVGLIGAGVSTVVLWIAVQVVGLALPLSGICAAVLSTFSNFLLNDAFTWRDQRSPSLRLKIVRLGRYFATTGLGNVVYLGVLLVTRRLGLYVFLGNIVAIGAGGSFNFLLHNRWTWRRADRH